MGEEISHMEKRLALNFSVIIPVAPGDDDWKNLLCDLVFLEKSDECLLVSPKDLTKDLDQLVEKLDLKCEIRYLYAELGRARQQNEGALHAKNQILWFLHCDSRISSNSFAKLKNKTRKKDFKNSLYYFDLDFLKDGPLFMIFNKYGVRLRSRLFKMPFGDQGFCLHAQLFKKLKSFDEQKKISEDYFFVQKAHANKIKIKPVGASLATSARKYQKEGWLKTTKNHLLTTFFLKEKTKTEMSLAIFVKTPGLSPLKTRLAKSLGKNEAASFYQMSLQATSAFAKKLKTQIPTLEIYWAVAEEAGLSHPLWNEFAVLSQGAGALGERLCFVYEELMKKNKIAFFMGADSPHLAYEKIARDILSFEKSKGEDFLLGETEDGGFYLFGGKKKISKKIWNAIDYSSENTFSQLSFELKKKGKIKLLEKSFDIDEACDLKNYKKLLGKKEHFLPEQEKIFKWANQLEIK